MKKIYLSILALITVALSFAQTPIITMVADGDCSGGNPKVLEIYASGTVDFAKFAIERQSNSSTSWSATQNLGALGTVTDAFVYVYYESSTGAGSFASEFPGATTTMASGTVNYNGNDRIRIIDTLTMATVDQFGVTDQNGTGEPWEYKDGYAKRLDGTSVNGGNFVVANWSYAKAGLDGFCGGATTFESIIGLGTYSTVMLPTLSFKTDSFEFNEGDGSVHLDTLLLSPAVTSPTTESFEIHLKSNSTASAADFDITGFPIPITLPQTLNLSLLNFTAQPLNVTLADDALVEGDEFLELVLRNANGINIGADSTIYVKIIDNDFPADTFVALSSNALTVNEGDASFDISLDYQQTGTNPNHTVDLQLITGNATDVDNFTTMTAAFNTLNEKFTVNITDDMLVEGNETLTFALVNATNGLMIGSDSIFTLTIEDNDYPYYSIDMLRGNDTDGAADSVNVKCWTSGVVLGNNLSAGLEFTIHDGTRGIGVYAPTSASNFGYTVQEGDSIRILGTVTQFRRFSQVGFLDTIIVLSTGNTIPTPTVVTDTLGEYTESELITLENVTYVSGTWGDNKTVTISANGKEYKMRIDDMTGVGSLTQPTGSFDVIGLGSQYNQSTTDFFKGYQIKPRYTSDIVLKPTLNMDGQGTTVSEDAGSTTIGFTVANDNGGTYTVDVALTGGNGTADDIDNYTTQTVTVSGGAGSVTINITDDNTIESTENFVFTLTNASNGLAIGNATFDLVVEDNDADAIETINVNDLKLYPNPAQSEVTLNIVSNKSQVATFRLVNILGSVVSSSTYVLNTGNNTINYSLENISKGNYAIEIVTEAGKHVERLLVK